MPTCVGIDGDLVSVLVDRAGAEETVAMVHLRRGRHERAAAALRRAQEHLAAAARELSARGTAAKGRAA